MNRGKILTLVGAIGLIIGALLPWIVAEAVFGGSISKSGIDGNGQISDGYVTAGIGVIVLVIAAVSKGESGKLYSIAGSILAGLAAIVLIVDFLDVNKMVFDTPFGVSAKIGIGLYLSIAAALVALVGGVQRVPEESRVQPIPYRSNRQSTEQPQNFSQPAAQPSAPLFGGQICTVCQTRNHTQNDSCLKCGCHLPPYTTQKL